MILSPHKQSNAEGKERYKTCRELSEQAMCKEQNQASIAINSEWAVLNLRKVSVFNDSSLKSWSQCELAKTSQHIGHQQNKY